MKKIIFLSLILILIIYTSTGVKAQDRIPEHQYFYITYIKLKDPSKESTYIDLLKHYGKPVCDYKVKDGSIGGWYAYECIMPAGIEKKYDFAVVTFCRNMQSVIDDTSDIASVFKKIFPVMTDKELETVFAEYDSARNIISAEVFEKLAATNNSLMPPLYAKINFMKTYPGKDSEYISMEENEWMKLHKKVMQMNLMADWQLDKKLLPQNIEETYNYLSVDFYNNINAMFDDGYSKAFNALWTTDERKKIFQNTNESRVFVSSQIWKLVTFSAGN